MASCQEDQSVNFYGSGIADVNEDNEGEIDITTEVRYILISQCEAHAPVILHFAKTSPY